jgi:hypothetical protein
MRDGKLTNVQAQSGWRSDESAACEIVHDRADDRVGCDSFEQRRAAGDYGHAHDQDCGDDGNYLLDALLTCADACYMLADARAAVGAYAAALDDQFRVALGAFDPGSQGHRGKRYEVRTPHARLAANILICGLSWTYFFIAPIVVSGLTILCLQPRR